MRDIVVDKGRLTSACTGRPSAAGEAGRQPNMFGVFQLVALAAIAALNGWLWYQVARALWTGRARVRTDVVRRWDRPLYYWLAVVGQTMLAPLWTVGIARGIMRWVSI